jgi:HD-GYP domain-containing protein (c-di-GMP phosphodiesterase class II)
MLSEEKLSLIINLGLDFNQARDLDLLLDRVLTDARRFVGADAGSIYIRKGGLLEFAFTQNATLQARLPPGKKLIYSSFTVPIDHGSIAGFVADTGMLLNIPDVQRLPADAPYTFSRKFDEISDYRTISMITVPLKTSQDAVIGVLQLINARGAGGGAVPFDPADEPFISHFAVSAAIAIERANMTRSMILRTIEMARLRDPRETGAHVKRVSSYAVAVFEAWARRRGSPEQEIARKKDVLKIASMLHDVGKVAVSDSILKKPARLTEEEFDAIKRHTWMGANLFADELSEYDRAAALIALTHHERWDGNGYPGHVDPADGAPLPGRDLPGGKARGRKGKEIPLFGRIVAVADVFDALSSPRSYKTAWDEERVLRELRREAGRQFDPEMVEALLFDLDLIRSIRARYPEQG